MIPIICEDNPYIVCKLFVKENEEINQIDYNSCKKCEYFIEIMDIISETIEEVLKK